MSFGENLQRIRRNTEGAGRRCSIIYSAIQRKVQAESLQDNGRVNTHTSRRRSFGSAFFIWVVEKFTDVQYNYQVSNISYCC